MEKYATLRIERAARSVRSVAPAMPMRAEMDRELVDAEAAEQRGYFLPDEDERIREVFARYLSVRAVLLEVVESIQPVLDELEQSEDRDTAPVGGWAEGRGADAGDQP